MNNLNKRANYGVKVEIKKYDTLIKEIFYDEGLIDKYVIQPNHTENLSDSFTLYLEEINRKLQSYWEEIKSIFYSSFEKGTKRVLDKEGKKVILEIGEVKDKRGIEDLIARQQMNFKSLSSAQAIKVMKIIADGRERGISAQDIAGSIKQGVKELTNNRAMTIARTEIIKSHTRGQTQVMKEAGIEKYLWVTSGNSNVCPTCEGFEIESEDIKGYLVDMAGSPTNPLPGLNSHPNCACTVIAYK
jgi:SPP1 gp7 family putative phage head morphogenesis protein